MGCGSSVPVPSRASNQTPSHQIPSKPVFENKEFVPINSNTTEPPKNTVVMAEQPHKNDTSQPTQSHAITSEKSNPVGTQVDTQKPIQPTTNATTKSKNEIPSQNQSQPNKKAPLPAANSSKVPGKVSQTAVANGNISLTELQHKHKAPQPHAATPAVQAEAKHDQNAVVKVAEVKKTKPFVIDNHAAFLSDGKPAQTVKYAGSTINEDTYKFLLSMKDNKMASILAKLYKPGECFTIVGLDENTLAKLSEEYASLCEYALDQLASAKDFRARVKWQASFLHLIQAAYQSRFGDFAFIDVKKKADTLRAKHPIGGGQLDPAAQGPGLDGIDYPKKAPEAKLWDYLTLLHEDKYQLQRGDMEHIVRNGEVAVPSEIGAVSAICEYVATIKDNFAEDLKSVFKRSQEFKSNAKGIDRAVYKMNEYATTKPRPSFNYLGDMVRCKAIYGNINDLREDFKTLLAKYKVLKVKDKLKTGLKNVTINIVYDQVIAEIQLVCGEVVGDYANHRIYEVYRCESIQEILRTILAWGDYRFQGFKPLAGAILPSNNLESQTYLGFIANTPFPLMKSKEYGLSTRDSVYLSEDHADTMGNVSAQRLVCYYDSEKIYGISLQDHMQLRKGGEKLKKILRPEGYIQNVSGTYDKTGIKKLVLHMMRGDSITIGKSVAGEKSFNVNIPQHCVVLGFGYRATEETGIQSIYCWFGLVPYHNKEVAEAALASAPIYGLPIRCPDCTHQLMWESSYNTDPLNCRMCEQQIPQNAGLAACLKDKYSLCSGCIYQENSNILPIPNAKKVKCRESHEYEWQYTTGSEEEFQCVSCESSYTPNTGSYTCPCEVHLCSGCYSKKYKFQAVSACFTFPTISSDFPCGGCNKPLIWYWNTASFGYNGDGYRCNCCEITYPGSAGVFHCNRCDYDVCSKCYNDSGRSDITKMPNFRNKMCGNGCYVTWQFFSDEPWSCIFCETQFPAEAGCYICPKKNCDGFMECAGCYLSQVVNFKYEDLKNNTEYKGDELKKTITPFGEQKAGLDCYGCGRELYWLWDRTLYAEGENYICNIHKGNVPAKVGGFFCLRCEFDLCSLCYKKDKEKDLVHLPNIASLQCPNDNELVWSYDMPKGWACTECGFTCEDGQAAFTCLVDDCGCDYNICSVCYKGKVEEGGWGACTFGNCGTCGQEMGWYWDTHEIGGNYENGDPYCNNCRNKIPHNAGIFNCNLCSYDGCSRCISWNVNGIADIFETEKLCPNGQGLKWFCFCEGDWVCSVCEAEMPSHTGLYQCNGEDCNCGGYSICAACSRNE